MQTSPVCLAFLRSGVDDRSPPAGGYPISVLSFLSSRWVPNMWEVVRYDLVLIHWDIAFLSLQMKPRDVNGRMAIKCQISV